MVVSSALALLGASHRTANFVVKAPTQALAAEVGDTAESLRQSLALLWLGQTLPNWARPCPIRVSEGEHLGAGGATSFVFHQGEVFDWDMEIQGSRERILDSVLPHEVTHTIFASHFRQPLPRWADEGACTTVEHESERAKQERMLIDFLQTGRGIPFSQMFAMKDYPPDILPLYAQGFSLARYLIEQGGREKYIAFISEGLKSGHWVPVTRTYYGYPSLAALQDSWLGWVRQGSPPLPPASSPTPAPTQLAGLDRRPRPEPNLIYRGQRQGFLAEQLGRLRPPWRSSRQDQPPADARVGVPAGAQHAAPFENPPLTTPPTAELPSATGQAQLIPITSGPAPGAIASLPAASPGAARPVSSAAPAAPPLPGSAAPGFSAPSAAPVQLPSTRQTPHRQVIVEWSRAAPEAAVHTATAPQYDRVRRPVTTLPRLRQLPPVEPARPLREPVLFDAPPRRPTTVLR